LAINIGNFGYQGEKKTEIHSEYSLSQFFSQVNDVYPFKTSLLMCANLNWIWNSCPINTEMSKILLNHLRLV